MRTTTMRLTAAALAATGALAAAEAPAQAGGPPITVPIDAAAPDAAFQLLGPADFQDVTVQAPAGTDFFVGVGTDRGVSVRVTGPGGVPLPSGSFDVRSDGDDAEGGVEVHAKDAGAYDVRVVPANPTAIDYPLDAFAYAWPDCRGGAGTRCTITPGKTKDGTFGAAFDEDWLLLRARPGVRYLATLAITGTYQASFALVDRTGRALAGRLTGLSGDRRFVATFPFVLPRTGGPYYLTAVASDRSHAGRGRYTVTVRPR